MTLQDINLHCFDCWTDLVKTDFWNESSVFWSHTLFFLTSILKEKFMSESCGCFEVSLDIALLVAEFIAQHNKHMDFPLTQSKQNCSFHSLLKLYFFSRVWSSHMSKWQDNNNIKCNISYQDSHLTLNKNFTPNNTRFLRGGLQQ